MIDEQSDEQSGALSDERRVPETGERPAPRPDELVPHADELVPHADEQPAPQPDGQPAQERAEPDAAEPDADEQDKAKRNSSFWRELPILLGVAIVVAIVVRAFILQTFYIPSPSMEHTLDINDRVLVNKLVYDFRSPHRGEVLVFKAPRDWRDTAEGEDFIKRVVGVGGDHVVCCDSQGRISVNGKPLNEKSYVYSENGVSDPPGHDTFDITVPKDRLWVMGDHRSSSRDSLEMYISHGKDIVEATIPTDVVVGRAFVVFWPVNRATWLSVPGTFDGVPDADR